MNEIRLPNGQKAKRVIQVFIGENDALHVAVDGVDGPPEMELVKHDLTRARQLRRGSPDRGHGHEGG